VKKALSLLLVCVMVFALLLAGCDDTPDQPADGTTASTTTTTAASGDNNGDADGGDATGDADGSTDSTTDGAVGGDEGNSPDNTDGDHTDGTTANQGGTSASSSSAATNTSTSTTKASSLSSVYTEPLMPSFIRNNDGTCTDRKTGVVFIDDTCNSLGREKLFDQSNLAIDGSQKDFFGGDDGRYIRANGTAGASWWFSYKIDSGITEVAIQSFTIPNHAGTGIINGFDVYVSDNGKRDWKKVDLTYNASADSPIGSGWVFRTYTAKNLGGYKYLKVEYTQVGAGDPFYAPNIGRVRVNNIGKMNDQDGNLEGRVSKTFYIDNKTGDDRNDGTSPETAWRTPGEVNKHFYQPGDKILFKAGGSFAGTLNIRGYGTAKDRLTIGTYGGTEKAKLSARGEIASVVSVAGTYTTIENLDISGKGAKIGLLVTAAQTGANKGILVQNCNVHDINSDDKYFSYSNGGIQLNATGIEPTWFDGAVVRNNTVDNVSRVGIYLTCAWGDRPGAAWGASGSLYKSDEDGWWPNVNCSISGNTLTNVHGDSILIISAKDTVVDGNYANDCFNIGDDPTKLKYLNNNGFSVACATFWCVNTNGTVFQNNEVGYTHLDAGYVDGEAFDLDGVNKDCVVQYNYTHNNVGGFLLMCDWQESITKDATHVIRFNLTVDDGWSYAHGSISTTTTYAGAEIYNNTFVQRSDTYPMAFIFSAGKNFVWRNNIFYGKGAGKIDSTSGATISGFLMDNNIFAGGATPPSRAGVRVKNAKTDDPAFKNAAFTHAKDAKANMSGAIAAFTPTKKIAGATDIKDNGGRDIAGTKFDTLNFYGCVKY